MGDNFRLNFRLVPYAVRRNKKEKKYFITGNRKEYTITCIAIQTNHNNQSARREVTAN